MARNKRSNWTIARRLEGRCVNNRFKVRVDSIWGTRLLWTQSAHGRALCFDISLQQFLNISTAIDERLRCGVLESMVHSFQVPTAG